MPESLLSHSRAVPELVLFKLERCIIINEADMENSNPMSYINISLQRTVIKTLNVSFWQSGPPYNALALSNVFLQLKINHQDKYYIINSKGKQITNVERNHSLEQKTNYKRMGMVQVDIVVANLDHFTFGVVDNGLHFCHLVLYYGAVDADFAVITTHEIDKVDSNKSK